MSIFYDFFSTASGNREKIYHIIANRGIVKDKQIVTIKPTNSSLVEYSRGFSISKNATKSQNQSRKIQAIFLDLGRRAGRT